MTNWCWPSKWSSVITYFTPGVPRAIGRRWPQRPTSALCLQFYMWGWDWNTFLQSALVHSFHFTVTRRNGYWALRHIVKTHHNCSTTQQVTAALSKWPALYCVSAHVRRKHFAFLFCTLSFVPPHQIVIGFWNFTPSTRCWVLIKSIPFDILSVSNKIKSSVNLTVWPLPKPNGQP